MRPRLNKRGVEAVFAAKTQRTTPLFTIRWRHGEQNVHRVAFAFSAKSGPSVLRNRFKRRWRHLIAENKPSASIGLDFVIIPRRSLSQIKESDWLLERERALKILHDLQLAK